MKTCCATFGLSIFLGLHWLYCTEAKSNADKVFQPIAFTQRGGAGSRVLAKGEEESKTHEVFAPLTQKVTVTEKEKPLIEDIEFLSGIVADIVKRANPRVQELYAKFRKYGLAR